MALWIVLAAVVFNVTFDRQVRLANYAFVASQLTLYRQGRPMPTINDGFGPVVPAAARRSALWFVLISLSGAALSAYAAGGRYGATAPEPAPPQGHAGGGGTASVSRSER